MVQYLFGVGVLLRWFRNKHYREHLSKPNVNLQEVNEGSQLGSVERNVLAVLDKRKENNPFEEFLLGSLYRAFLSERIPMLWDLDTVIGGFNANLDYLEAMASLGEYGSEKWDFFRIFPLGIPNNTTSSEFLHGDREFFDSLRHESGVYSKVDKRSLKYSNFGLVFEITDFNSALKLFAPYLKAAVLIMLISSMIICVSWTLSVMMVSVLSVFTVSC